MSSEEAGETVLNVNPGIKFRLPGEGRTTTSRRRWRSIDYGNSSLNRAPVTTSKTRMSLTRGSVAS